MNNDAHLHDYIDSMLTTDVAPVEAPAQPIPQARREAPVDVAQPAASIAAVAERLREMLDSATSPAAPASARPKRWLCFDVAGQSFGIELLKVQEVQRVPTIVPVRGAPTDVLGVINLRGEIVHVIDLGLRLGLSSSNSKTDAARVIVLEESGKTAGLLVSAVADVASLAEDSIERTDASLRSFPCSQLVGIARHGRAVVALLNAAELLQ